MGQCLSTSAASEQFSSQEMRATHEVIVELGSMNSAITKETNLLKACKNTATDLLDSIRDIADPSSDAASLVLITGRLDEMIDHMYPIKTTLDNLISRANREYNAFNRTFSDFKRPDRTMAGVMMIHAAANALSPSLYGAIQSGTQLRRGVDVICETLQEKYSTH